MLVSQVLSFRHTKRTSKNVADTTFKVIIRLSKRRWQDLRPLPPISCLIYSRSVSLFGWIFPVIDKIFLVLILISLVSCIVQSSIPILGVVTGFAKVLCAIVLLKAGDHRWPYLLYSRKVLFWKPFFVNCSFVCNIFILA